MKRRALSDRCNSLSDSLSSFEQERWKWCVFMFLSEGVMRLFCAAQQQETALRSLNHHMQIH